MSPVKQSHGEPCKSEEQERAYNAFLGKSSAFRSEGENPEAFNVCFHGTVTVE